MENKNRLSFHIVDKRNPEGINLLKGIIGNLLLFEICISWQSNWVQAFTNLFSIRYDYVSI